jgi:hypothetical protein
MERCAPPKKQFSSYQRQITAAPYRPFVQNLLPPHQTKLKNNLRLPKCNNRELEKLVNAGEVVTNGSPITNASSSLLSMSCRKLTHQMMPQKRFQYKKKKKSHWIRTPLQMSISCI